jgi:hypothetical protein
MKVERQIEPRPPVLLSRQRQHLHRVQADRSKPQRIGHSLLDLVLLTCNLKTWINSRYSKCSTRAPAHKIVTFVTLFSARAISLL